MPRTPKEPSVSKKTTIAASDPAARRGNPVTQTDEVGKRHNVTLPLSLSLRLMQAVGDEKLRRAAAQQSGRVTDSTVIAQLIDQYLPPLRK